MTLSAQNTQFQYQRTQLNYEMTVSKVSPLQKEQELLEETSTGLEATNLPILYMSESDLSSGDFLNKMVLEASIFQSYSQQSVGLFPYANHQVSHEPSENLNPYADYKPQAQSFLYGASEEYYEKQTIDFQGELRIVTPEGEYNIELKFSYTKEFYEKNETIIQMTHQNLKEPLEINMSEDDGRYKNIKSLYFYFEMIKSEEKRIERTEALEEIKEAKDKHDLLTHNQDKKSLPIEHDFNVWVSENRSEYHLVALKQGDMEVFLANSFEESSYAHIQKNEDGYSVSSGYSRTESS